MFVTINLHSQPAIDLTHAALKTEGGKANNRFPRYSFSKSFAFIVFPPKGLKAHLLLPSIEIGQFRKNEAPSLVQRALSCREDQLLLRTLG